jgi:hypothetical protein
MRNLLLLATAIPLAACGGGTGVQTVGGTAPPTGSPTPTPTTSFVNPTEAKTYTGLGVVQHYEYNTRSDGDVQSGQLYAGDANTVRDSGISVTYDPRDAIFDITISRPKGIVSVAGARFQDPVHRTDFGGAREPQAGVPELATAKQIQYLQSGSGTGNLLNPASPGYPAGSDYAVGDQGYSSTTSTFFYQKPGTTTKYVTYAGFVRNTLSVSQQTDVGSTTPYLRNTYSLDRAAFVFGEQTSNSAVPRSGTGTYTGDMLATVVFNPLLDTDPGTGSYLQWIDGSQTTQVDFGTLAVTTTMNGKLTAPTRDAYSDYGSGLAAGTDFHATATSTIDLAGRGGFTGTVNSACFAAACNAGNALTIAGSSVDGAFYGPNADEIGAGFRIVGGTPDQRIDILGTFTGKK